MRSDTCLHAHGKLCVRVKSTKPSGMLLRIDMADGSGSEVSLFVDDFAQLDAIADAIYHAKMDRDAPLMRDDVEIHK